MAWGALSLAIASFVCIGLGVFFTPVPGLGALFSFTAPVLALAGIIIGGRAVSRSKAVPAVAGGGAIPGGPGGSESSGLALAAVIASALAFVPAVITALTCGACNALCAAGEVSTRHSFKTGIDPFDMLLGPGVRGPDLLESDAGAVGDSATVDAGAGVQTEPSPGSQPVLPPPPLAPGPPR